MKSILSFFLALVVSAVAQTSTLTINTTTGLINIPGGSSTPNFAALKIGGVTIAPIAYGSGVATFLATPSSANLAAAVTGETGTGALVFGTSPDFTTAITLGGVAVPTISSSHTLTNKTIAIGSNTVSGTAAQWITAGVPTDIAVASVNTQTAKLALTGKNVGDLVEVTYTGTGNSVWRYEGGGESTATNWKLLGSLRAGQMEVDQDINATTTFADATGCEIDHVPVGRYNVRLLVRAFSNSGGGLKMKFTGTSTIAANSRAHFVHSSGVADGDISNLADTSGFASYADWGGTRIFFLVGFIKVTSAGSFKLQVAQNTAAGHSFIHDATVELDYIGQ